MPLLDAQGARIELFDPKAADELMWVAFNTFFNRMLSESFPDDPPFPLQRTIDFWSMPPEFVVRKLWVAWHDSQVIGSGVLEVYLTPDNKHAADSNVEVLPEYRRQGLGTRILAQVAEHAHSANRSLLLGQTYDSVPAGAAFLEHIGARVGLETHVNQLEVVDVDHALLRRWQERARERASDFELGMWEIPYPEAELEALAALKQAMNDAPRGDLNVEDFVTTPEQLRQFDESFGKRGIKRWTLYARHVPTGELAGYTEVFWNPQGPTILYQEDTGVWPKYRNRGLGRWLKADMLERMLRDRPEIKYVRTGNADSNAAMLNINYEMGFKPYRSTRIWQVEVEKVMAYVMRNA